LGLASP